MRLAMALVGSSESPPELIRYQLRQMYHCTPLELRANKGDDLIEMLRDLTVQSEIEKARQFKRNLSNGK